MKWRRDLINMKTECLGQLSKDHSTQIKKDKEFIVNRHKGAKEKILQRKHKLKKNITLCLGFMKGKTRQRNCKSKNKNK